MQKNCSLFWMILILAATAILPAGGAQAQLDAPHNASSATGCLSCHQMNSTYPKLLPPLVTTPQNIDDSNDNNLCWSCHNPTGSAPYMPTHSSLQTDASYGSWTVECWVCHNQHAQEQFRKYGAASYAYTGNYAGVDNTGPNAIITVSGTAMTPDQYAGYIVVPNTARANYNYKIIGNTANTLTVRGLVNTAYAAAGNPLGISYGKFIRATIDLANIGKPAESRPVRLFKPTGSNSFADGDPAAIDGICEVCHTDTSAWHNDGTLAGVDAHSGLKGSNCITCHPHSEGFRAVYECLDCHDNSINDRAAVGQQFNGNSHHVQTGSTITSDKCYQCHWEADAGGRLTGHHSATPGAAVDLVIYGAGTRPETYTAGTTAVAYTANGSRAQILSLNSHCLGCHSDQNNSTQPFADGKTPKQYAWDGTSVAARYSQTGTTPWGKYSSTAYPNVTPKDRRTKAFSAHGNAVNNEGGWDLNETWPNTRNGATNVACFDCHNSHGSTVAGTTTSYATSDTLNGGILKETDSGRGGYSVTYKPEAGGGTEEKNLRNAGASLCLDCHLTQTAGLSPLGYETPWGYQSTFQSGQPITGYFDSPYLAPGGAGTQQRYAYKGLTNNAGGHFGASSPLNSTPMHSINGLCTPCHDPHGVTTNTGVISAANKPFAVPLLKGTWLTSPYREDAAPLETNRWTGTIGASIRSDPGYHIDQNTFVSWNFASTAGISQDVNVTAGLCLQCHTNDGSAADIDPDGGTQNNQWGTMDRVHDTVKGWGSGAKHKFSCSKCHTPHNGSALPRLMVSNCLDSKHRGRKTFGGAPSSQTVSGTVDCGGPASGSGKFPGGGHGTGTGCDGSGSNTYAFGGVSCHDSVGNGSWPENQLWNQVTSWSNSPPDAPTPVEMPDTTSTTVTLAFSTTDPEGDPVEYYVAIDDTSNFSSPNYNSGWIAETSFTFTVGNNKTWHWRVKARDTHNESGWSASDSFMVSDGLAPGQVTLASPANNAKITNYPDNVTFTWNTQPALAEYRLWIDDESGFTSPFVYDSGWIAATSQWVNIATAGTYYWRVQARDSVSHATGTVSATRNIVVNKAPSVPDLTPEPDTTSTDITLEWGMSTDPEENTPIVYYLQVDDASNFSSPNFVLNWSTASSFSFTGANNIWYWRVKARDSMNIESAWSLVDSFDIYIPGAPAAPTLFWPTNNYWGQVGYPAGEYPLQWNASSGATEYYCEYWGASTGNSGWTTATSFNPGDLPDNSYYYWRVKARNAEGESGWSVIWSWYDYYLNDSCPFVFTWNGSEYEYVTDIQGPVIGLPSVTPAARSVGLFRPSSIVLNNLVPDNEKYRIKLRETLKEITYLDDVKLLVADYPEGYELVSSTAENTYSYGYVNSDVIYTIKDPRLPVSAYATNGDDILASITTTDNLYAPLDHDSLEYITLDFGDITDPANAKLVIDGWTIYKESLRIADPVQPYIEVLDAENSWVKVLSFGEPAGDLKRMVVPLGNIFQNSDQRIRLHLGRKSGGRWRLDRVMLDESSPVPVMVRELPARHASLHHAGMVPHTPSSLETRIFAEDGSLPDLPSAYGYGKFTRYGDILPLLATTDDKFAIMRHGDAVDLEFDEIEASETGMVRSYLLQVDLYYKSFRVENNVEPLPFHDMSVYPPADGESYPTDAEYLEYLETYNTREYIEGQ